MLNKKLFGQKLVNWYTRHKRDLPWRHTTDPYLIWLSEVILQQTRVKQGMPYYLAFAGRFPTVQALAEANEKDVLRLWQGLGYYARARNMHQTAKIVSGHYNGQFPASYAGLLALRGIGPYTAAAIASFAFREPVAVLDGNVFRVLSRLLGIDTDIASHAGKREFSTLANELLDVRQPDSYNQAIMEFGAMLCTPASPQCMFCPFQSECVAFLSGRQDELPVKSRKLNTKTRYFHYLIFIHEEQIAMKERAAKDIWRGLYDFHLLEADQLLSTDELLARLEPQIAGEFTLVAESEVYTHVLTHQRVYARFWHASVTDALAASNLAQWLGITFLHLPEVNAAPKPVLIDNYLKNHFF